MKNLHISLGVVLTICLPLWADHVELNNGDRLTGDIKNLSSGQLNFETHYAGPLQIQWAHVKSLSTSEPFLVQLANGKSSHGLISSSDPGLLNIGSSVSVSTKEIVSIQKEVATLSAPGLFQNWTGSIDGGYNFNRGNTDIENLAISFQPERETDTDRIRVRARSFYSVQNRAYLPGVGISEIRISSNMQMGQARYDRFMGSKSFIFALGRVEKDERERLNLRTSQGGGFGMEFRPSSQTYVSLFGGLTFLQEDFENIEKKFSAEGLAGIEFETDRFAPFIISSKGQLLPGFSEDRYRLEWDLSIRIPLFAGFNLGMEMFENFDSNPPRENVRKSDFGLISTIGLTF